MLDASNPEQSKAKKAKHTSRPPQRFWPFTSTTAENTESEPNTTHGQSITTTAPVSAPSQNMPGQTIILGPGSCKFYSHKISGFIKYTGNPYFHSP